MKKAFLALLSMYLISHGSLTSAEIGGNPEKISGWIFACETDTTGAVVAGNCNRLTTGVHSGGDVKVKLGDAASSKYYPCDQVHAYLDSSATEQYGCFSFEQVTFFANSGALPLVIHASPFYFHQYVDTEGRYGITRANIYSGANQSSTITVARVRWYVRVR